jgi:hypothetical protein
MGSINVILLELSSEQLDCYEPTEKFWLQRELWSDNGNSGRGNVKLLVLKITFKNSSENEFRLRFSNISCQAELHNLKVVNETGAPIIPKRNIHIRPLQKEEALIRYLLAKTGL